MLLFFYLASLFFGDCNNMSNKQGTQLQIQILHVILSLCQHFSHQKAQLRSPIPVLLFLHCSTERWWWVHVWRLASTSSPFNPCHLLLNFSKIILAFSCNFWISYLMRLSAALNSTTFICSWDCLHLWIQPHSYAHEIVYTFEFNHIHMLMRLSTPLNSTTFIHMLLLFIVMFSGFLPSKTPSLWKRFAMDFLHHRIA
jgi:hypothetical protein